MSFRRVGGLAALALATLLWMSCGDIYRPVVIPIAITPPNSANFHAVFGISTNAQANPGAALQIDVSGDTNIGEANMGINPTHAAIMPNNARVYVASAGTACVENPSLCSTAGVFAGGTDIVTAFSPATGSSTATGIGTLTTFTFPNVGPIDSTGKPAWFCSYLPDFLTTTETTQMYVANFGVDGDPGCAANLASTDSVAILSNTAGTMTNIAYLPPGAHPVALAETANAQHLYVVNQGNNTVTDLSPVDLSTSATITVGTTPVWAVARPDNQRVYVLTQGDGMLVPIDVATNTVLPSQTNLSVGIGANFLLYDPHRNRLYVANPTNGNVYVFSATGGIDLSGNPNDTPTLLATISMTAGSHPPCSSACSPISVAALPDASRFYVASYQSESACSDPNVGSTAPCIIPLLSVFDAPSMTLRPATSSLRAPSISLLGMPSFPANQYALPPVSSCLPSATYSPGTTRFRMYATAAADSSHVYVSICDAGTIADVVTKTDSISTGTNSPDTLVTDIPAPFAACGATCNSVATITSLSAGASLVTFAAANNFSAGTRVAVSGTGTTLDGQTFTVLAAGLSSTTFSCNLNSPTDKGATSTKGKAVPLASSQAPIFLLTGQ